ncbi:hypothetical protein FHS04_002351 [Mesoflavibacter sabulilitoris]|uniref:Cardiolipin synthetase n=1 Tax=Mesoflavibacter zeaxanthinifaciens subsp. sabulilitoris TaxID=1520893 RepID=A0A2T1NF69_9FLAO|nr:hypothetical protein [Mesoflavibacter zeaxanthinifaciens]MBB3124824.1 hypothetical protein [Mesoflavibacter zeaxanthinifaciens subsp. sabulilitoris]PSG91085.1 hypothetical protein C7H61_07485 [Mesoflavibacter zeaxanthinifaciens subsp. sabulilitoris]
MRLLLLNIILILLLSCENTTQLKDYWKNPDFETYNPKKILVIGMTKDDEARHLFESHFQTQLQLKDLKVDKSQNILTTDYLNKKHTETEINKIEDSLIKLNYDTVIFSRIVGVKNKIKYSEEYYKTHTYKHNFKDDFLKYQDQFYNPSYYENYNVYNAETSIYCLCPSKERTLIWKGYIDIVDPKNINDSIEDYIKLLILVLEEEAIIPTPK